MCGVLWKVWKFFRHLVSDTWQRVHPCEELTFLGITREGELLPAVLTGIHRIMWKMVIISLTQAEFEKKPVSPNSIINMTVRRVTVRIRALHAAHVVRSRQAELRGLPPPKPTTTNRWISPIATVGKGGDLVWHEVWRRRAREQGVQLRVREPGGLPEREGEQSPQPRSKARMKFVRPRNS